MSDGGDKARGELEHVLKEPHDQAEQMQAAGGHNKGCRVDTAGPGIERRGTKSVPVWRVSVVLGTHGCVQVEHMCVSHAPAWSLHAAAGLAATGTHLAAELPADHQLLADFQGILEGLDSI